MFFLNVGNFGIVYWFFDNIEILLVFGVLGFLIGFISLVMGENENVVLVIFKGKFVLLFKFVFNRVLIGLFVLCFFFIFVFISILYFFFVSINN